MPDMTEAESWGRTVGIVKKPNPVDQIFTWILSGASEHDILESIATTWPDEDAQPLLVAAFARITEAGKIKADTLRGWVVEATRHVYQQALAAGDHATALRAIKQLQCMPE